MAIAAVVSAAMVTPEWLGATLGPWAVEQFQTNRGAWVALAIAVSLLAAMVAGAWNGLLVAGFGVQPIIATLILMVAGRGIAQMVSHGAIYTYDVPMLAYVGKGALLTLPFSICLVVLMLLLTYALTRLTALGLMIEAIGDNQAASHFTGLRARTIKFLVYVFSGLCAGLAGLIESTNVSSANANQIGLWYELDAIFAVVVGGTALTGGRFFLVGSVAGALLIQTLTNTMYAQQVLPEIALVPKALVIVLVCLLQSRQFRARLVAVWRRLRGPGRSRTTMPSRKAVA
jgi:simple sugar transport system permease protein